MSYQSSGYRVEKNNWGGVNVYDTKVFVPTPPPASTYVIKSSYTPSGRHGGGGSGSGGGGHCDVGYAISVCVFFLLLGSFSASVVVGVQGYQEIVPLEWIILPLFIFTCTCTILLIRCLFLYCDCCGCNTRRGFISI